LNAADSALFIEELEKEELDQEIPAALVLKAIGMNKELLWEDAAKGYGFLNVA